MDNLIDFLSILSSKSEYSVSRRQFFGSLMLAASGAGSPRVKQTAGKLAAIPGHGQNTMLLLNVVIMQQQKELESVLNHTAVQMPPVANVDPLLKKSTIKILNF